MFGKKKIELSQEEFEALGNQIVALENALMIAIEVQKILIDTKKITPLTIDNEDILIFHMSNSHDPYDPNTYAVFDTIGKLFKKTPKMFVIKGDTFDVKLLTKEQLFDLGLTSISNVRH